MMTIMELYAYAFHGAQTAVEKLRDQYEIAAALGMDAKDIERRKAKLDKAENDLKDIEYNYDERWDVL